MKSFGMDNNLVTYRLLNGCNGVFAFTTTRHTFSGSGVHRFTGEPDHEVLQNRQRLAGLLGIKPEHLVFPRQQHTDCVVRFIGMKDGVPDATDALVTDQTGICLCIQTADCVPVLLYDPEKRAVAAVHSGWRGTVKQIARNAIMKMEASFHSNPSDILAVVGPSISPEVYEVGSEVADAIKHAIPNGQKALVKKSRGTIYLDLWEANRQILLDCGISEGNIEVLGECTFLKSEKYFSARREGVETGRLVSGIMMDSSDAFKKS